MTLSQTVLLLQLQQGSGEVLGAHGSFRKKS
jgi:hypothetical protein